MPQPLPLALEPLNATVSIGARVYTALKEAIMAADIYAQREEIRLDERQLSRALGVSRTPIREAMTLLEQEGFLRTVPPPRRLHRQEDQEGNHRDHRGLRGAGEHGGEARDDQRVR